MDKESDVIYEAPTPKMQYVKEGSGQYQAVEKYTYQDYLSWPDDERWELIDGDPIRLNSPTRSHQKIINNLSNAFHSYLVGRECEAYTAPFDVCLHLDGIADTVVQPDIFVICDQTIIDEKNVKGAPDLVVEVLSPSTARIDRVAKLAKYEKHGVKEYWIIDTMHQKVYVYVLNSCGRYNNPITYQHSDDIIQATVLAEFRISHANIFAKEAVLNNELLINQREQGIRQGIEQGVAQGIKQGTEQGVAQGIKQVAKNLKATGMSSAEIVKYTGLSTVVIENLEI